MSWYSARSKWVESASSGNQIPSCSNLTSQTASLVSALQSDSASGCLGSYWMDLLCQAASVAQAPNCQPPLLLLGSSSLGSEDVPYCFSQWWQHSCCHYASWCRHSVSSMAPHQDVGMGHHIQPHTGECSLCPCMYDSGPEGVNHFATLGGDYFNVFSRIQYSSSDFVVFQGGSHSLDCQKVGHMGIDPGCHRCLYLILFYHIHDVAYCGGSQDHRDLNHKLDKSGTTRAICSHHSPGLHLLEPIWWCCQKVKWGCFPDLCRWLICLWGLREAQCPEKDSQWTMA